jgi:hypothetical protein
VAKKAQLDAVRPVLNALDAEVTAVEKVLDAVEAGADKATDVLESGLEKVADVVPEALDKSVVVTTKVTRRGVRAFRDPRVVVAFSAAAVVIGAAGVGYFTYKLMRNKLEKEFDERVDHEIETMRDFYIRKYKTNEYASPQSAAEALGAKTEAEAQAAAEAAEALERYNKGDVKQPSKAEPVAYDKVEVAEEVVLQGVTITSDGVGTEVSVKETNIPVDRTRNIFVEGRPTVLDDWDAEAEEANRNPAYPYVISYEEFMENTFEHTQSTLTYYEGDDVLAESDGSPILESDKVIGDTLDRFGHGSKDPNVVYVRNEITECDFEVVRHSGDFADQVPGLRHSAEPLRRFRRGGDE